MGRARSAFAQSFGYVLAGAGPLLVGVLHGATGGWAWTFVLLFCDLVLMAMSGWYVAQPRYVEDDLEAVGARRPRSNLHMAGSSPIAS